MNTLINRIIWLVVLVPLIYLAFAWSKLPAIVPIHFDLEGHVNRYGRKTELLTTVIILSAMSLLVYFILLNIHRIDPKRYAIDNRLRLQKIGFSVSIFIAALTCLIIYSCFQQGSMLNHSLVLGATGLLFAIIGNYLPNLKPNYFAGIRLPWTLEDPENWKKTHSLAGKLWFAGGLLAAIICLLTPEKIALIIFYVITGAIILIPCIYSYQFFRKQKTAKPVN